MRPICENNVDFHADVPYNVDKLTIKMGLLGKSTEQEVL